VLIRKLSFVNYSKKTPIKPNLRPFYAAMVKLVKTAERSFYLLIRKSMSVGNKIH
jgi:hypothetical protein